MTQRYGWLFMVALLLVVGCGTKGSGKVGAETRVVDPFSAIEVRGVIDLDLAEGPAQSVELGGDDNLLSLVVTEVSGDRLIIGTEKNVRPDLPLVATVRVAAPIREIVGSGATDIRARDLKGDALRVWVSGAGSAELSGRVGSSS